MVEQDLLRKKLNFLIEYIKDLEERKQVALESYCKDKSIQRIIERTLHLAIECCLDIGNHMISSEAYRQPNDSRDIFMVLYENRIVPEDLLPRLQDMASFRNLLVHDYAEIDPKQVFENWQNGIKDLEAFGKIIAELL